MKYFTHELTRTNSGSAEGSSASPSSVVRVFPAPGVASAGAGYERYSGPTLSSTRRRLFVDNDSPSDRGTPARAPPQPLVSAVPVQNVPGEAVPVTPVPGQTLVTMATATVTANNGQTVTIPVQGEQGGVGLCVLLWRALESFPRFGWSEDMKRAFGREGCWGAGMGNPRPESPVPSTIPCAALS